MKTRRSILAASALAALIVSAPLAFAGKHGMNHDSRWDRQAMCENFRDGKAPFNMAERRAEMAKRNAEMADRLKLNEEQREIWREIQQERQQKNMERMEQWREKMQRRCDRQGN
ncbi:hypothetical protein [Marinobacter oulmenensis]|uniref:Spy/CpxP family protein refolding chaperone n=1 Tax=Marinobacter oulmenensis TaxID=643747 RepID=A0A840UMD3_9GAMM|nr:hypothetical protein [Marinobacter oulmenensis]MBB5322007.1 Spy/CpxP family protein refolding chaperone [Marinobacter oulmenensis]